MARPCGIVAAVDPAISQAMRPAGAHQLTLCGDDYFALPEGALYRPADHSLFLADAHLGKADIFQSAGLNVPVGHVDHDLARLCTLFERLAIKRLLILGDWIHARLEGDSETVAAVARFREATAQVDCHLLVGNHDRGIQRHLSDWAITPLAEGEPIFGIQPFHVPPTSIERDSTNLILAGHLHPAVRLQPPGGDRVRLPCFLQKSSNFLILPAFGSFTGGALVHPETHETALALFDDRVLPVPHSWLERHRRGKRSRR